MLSAPLRFVVMPLAVAVLGTQAAPDGRAAHRFALDWLRFRLACASALGGPGGARSRASRCAGTASCAVRWDARRAAAASRAGDGAGAGDVQRAGRAARPWPADRAAGRAGDAVRRAVRRARSWRCGHDAVPVALRASEHPRRPGRRAGGAVSAWTRCPIRSWRPRTSASGCGGWRGSRSRSRPTSRCGGCAARTRPSGYAEQAEALLDERRQSAAAWRSYLNGHEAHLRELRSFMPEVYLAVSLRRRSALGPRRRSAAPPRRGPVRRRRSAVPIPAVGDRRRWSSPRSARSAAPRRACRCGARRRASCSGCCAARRAAASPSRCWMITGSRAR